MKKSNCYTEMFFLDSWYLKLMVILWWIILIKMTINLLLPNKRFKHWNNHRKIGEIYLGGKKTKISDDLFIVKNMRIDCHMDAAEFEGLLYNTLPENPFNNQIINIKNSEDDWTISDYIFYNLGIKIGETMTYLSFH